MSGIENIIAEVVESFSLPRDYRLIRIRKDGTEDLLADDLTWLNVARLGEEILPTLKPGERLSIRERPQFGY